MEVLIILIILATIVSALYFMTISWSREEEKRKAEIRKSESCGVPVNMVSVYFQNRYGDGSMTGMR